MSLKAPTNVPSFAIWSIVAYVGSQQKIKTNEESVSVSWNGGGGGGGDPPSFQAKKKFHEDDDLVFPPGIMRSQRRKLDRALSFFTTDPPKYLTLGNIAILRLSSVFPSPYIWRWCIPSQQFLHLSISPISIRFSIPIFSPVVPFFFFLYLYIYIRTRSNVFGMFNTQIINWSFTFDVHFIAKKKKEIKFVDCKWWRKLMDKLIERIDIYIHLKNLKNIPSLVETYTPLTIHRFSRKKNHRHESVSSSSLSRDRFPSSPTRLPPSPPGEGRGGSALNAEYFYIRLNAKACHSYVKRLKF